MSWARVIHPLGSGLLGCWLAICGAPGSAQAQPVGHTELTAAPAPTVTPAPAPTVTAAATVTVTATVPAPPPAAATTSPASTAAPQSAAPSPSSGVPASVEPTPSDALEAPPAAQFEPPTQINSEPPASGRDEGASITAVTGVLATRPPAPIRKQQRLSLLADLGWNSLVGFGPELAFHIHPSLTLEGGAGLALEGWKYGMRTRVNLMTGALTPFFGVGLMHATGVTPVDVSSSEDPMDVISVISIRPSTYVQGVVGLDWIDRNSFNLVTCVGYAWLLGGSNITVLSGTLEGEEARVMDAILGSGIVISLAMGYSFF